MEDRKHKRSQLIIPALLRDKDSSVVIKVVILDISKKGMRMLTNDKLVRMTDAPTLKKKTFLIDFDFFDLDTSGIEGRIVNVKKGAHHQYEKQVGVEFTKIDPDIARDINRIILGQLN